MRGLQLEFGAAWRRYRSALVTVGLLSAVLNVLLLGGSLYLMMIYDSVLPSHSVPTLVGLFVMVTVVYAFQAGFDHLRQRILGALATELDQSLSGKVQRAIGEVALRDGRTAGDGLVPMRDLDNVRAFLSGTGPATLLDLPWAILFLGVLTFLHVWLGAVTLVGMIVVLGLTALTNRIGKRPVESLAVLSSLRAGIAESNVRHVETLSALGMRGVMLARWQQVNREWLDAQDSLSATAGQLGMLSKIFRMFLQSAVLTVGALLVLDGQASGGVIFAASLISGRALAPIDQVIGNWKALASARAGWSRLKDVLSSVPEDRTPNVRLPLPSRALAVDGLTVCPPGETRPNLVGVSFSITAGSVVGVVGPSGAGKTTLARAVLGLWPARAGSVRLDGAALDQWHPEVLGNAFGYLPQAVEIFDGTVAENISRFSRRALSDKVMAAAKAAGVHDLVVKLPHGYETQVGPGGSSLSAGQRQRIALARALYDEPFLLVLDEPNSNLDQEGELALNRAIAGVRERGGIVLVIAHRSALLAEATHVAFVRDGRLETFGPRDAVLNRIVATRPTGNLPANGAAPMVSAD